MSGHGQGKEYMKKRGGGLIIPFPKHCGAMDCRTSKEGMRQASCKKVFDARGRDEVDNRLETWMIACVIPFNAVPLIYCHGVVMAINDGPKGYKSLGY